MKAENTKNLRTESSNCQTDIDLKIKFLRSNKSTSLLFLDLQFHTSKGSQKQNANFKIIRTKQNQYAFDPQSFDLQSFACYSSYNVPRFTRVMRILESIRLSHLVTSTAIIFSCRIIHRLNLIIRIIQQPAKVDGNDRLGSRKILQRFPERSLPPSFLCTFHFEH